jgi:hypothetical protein
MRDLRLALFAACAVFTSGPPVGAADEVLVTVEGTVTYDGKPLTDATITLHLKDDQFVGARVKDGRFRVDRVPVGEAHVTVESKKVPLPAKYADTSTSALIVEVKQGKTTADFRLSK